MARKGRRKKDGNASSTEFATALIEDGMLALARIQRKFRLLDSPYRTPQTYVGGPRLDGALAASTGGTATTKAMGKGSTQFQHLVQTELPTKVLEGWLELWAQEHDIDEHLRVQLRPQTAGSDLLELNVLDESGAKVADIVCATIQDRRQRHILSIREETMRREPFRRKRLMTLMHLFLLQRYKIHSVHYVIPTDDARRQSEGMKAMGIYDQVHTEIGDIIVANVNTKRVRELAGGEDDAAIKALIAKI